MTIPNPYGSAVFPAPPGWSAPPRFDVPSDFAIRSVALHEAVLRGGTDVITTAQSYEHYLRTGQPA